MLPLVPTSCSFHRVGKAVSDLAALASVADELNKSDEQWWNDAVENGNSGIKKPVPVPLRIPQISHGLISDRNRSSAMRVRRLTA